MCQCYSALVHSSVNLAGILGHTGADPEGLAGARGEVGGDST